MCRGHLCLNIMAVEVNACIARSGKSQTIASGVNFPAVLT